MSLSHYIYVSDLKTLSLYILLAFVVWGVLCWFLGHNKYFRYACVLPILISIYGILLLTVLGRSTSSQHIFVFSAAHTSEFYRELFMNALLYFPLGLSLSVLIGPWTILCGFVLSVYIELWQFITGTGIGQVTDILANALGCCLGALPYLVVKYVKNQPLKNKTIKSSHHN